MDKTPSSADQLSERYHLLNKIGQGGMGTVHRAQDRLTGQIVALKQVVIHPTDLQFGSRQAGSNTHDAMLSLAVEFRTLASLRHPNIVEVLDYGFTLSEDGSTRHPFFTMRLIEHARVVTDYPIQTEETHKVGVVIEILQALSYLHRRGIIHRDLKPGNVLISSDEQVKVMDFGLALHQSQSVSDVYGNAVGTLAYMAPELFEDVPATEQSDLYSLGVIAYELLVGQHPFKAKNIASLLTNVMTRKADTSSLKPELAEVLNKLLGKTAPERYDSAEAVIAALCKAIGQPQPQEDPLMRESFLQAARFVGREDELALLTDALENLIDGSAFLIGGESGVGKSRLLDELRIVALVEGVTVLRGQAAADGGLPYQLWRDPVRRLLLSTPVSDLEASVLKELVPDIGDLIGRTVTAAPSLTGNAAHQRLTLMIARLFKHFAGQPLLLILEDLHWSAESLELLKALLPLLEAQPLIIVGSYRDDERPDLPDELAGMQLLPLKRLSPEAIARLSMAMLGDAGAQPHIVDLLQRETEGNVFFLVEVVRALAEDAGRMSDIGDTTLPQKIFAGGVTQVIERQLSRVPQDGYPLLKRAAITGRQLDLAVMGALSEASHPLEAWLNRCASAAVLEVSENQWRFTHDKIREHLIAQLDSDERALLHRQVAQAIEQAYPQDEAYAQILLEHWRQAGDAAKIAHYTLIAGDQLLKLRKYRVVRTIAERCLTLNLPAQSECEVYRLLGEACVSLSDYPAGETAYHQSLDLADSTTQRARALNGLATVSWRQGNLANAQTLAQQALDLAQASDDLREMSKSLTIFAVTNMGQGNFQIARDYSERSYHIRVQLGEKQDIASHLGNLAIVLRILGDYTQARTYMIEALEIFSEIGDRQGMSHVLNNLAVAFTQEGDYSRAKDYAQQALTIVQELGDKASSATALGNLAVAHEYTEDFAEAQLYQQRALKIHREVGNRQGIIVSLQGLISLALQQQEPYRMTDYLREFLDLYQVAQVVPILMGLIGSFARFYFHQGEYERAAEYVGLVLAHAAARQETKDHNQKLKERLEAVLALDLLESALQRGAKLELVEVISQLEKAFLREPS